MKKRISLKCKMFGKSGKKLVENFAEKEFLQLLKKGLKVPVTLFNL